MRTHICALLLCCIGNAFAGDVVIGVQNGMGQSFELNRSPEVKNSWNYRGDVYVGVSVARKLMIQPSLSYSPKGSISKIYGTQIVLVDSDYQIVEDRSNPIEIPARSQVLSAVLGVKPFVDMDRFRLSLLVGPRIDYIAARKLDSSQLGGGDQDVTSATSRWIPGLNIDLGCDYRIGSFSLGLVFDTEIDFADTEAEFNEKFRSYKHSLMVDVAYYLRSQKNG